MIVATKIRLSAMRWSAGLAAVILVGGSASMALAQEPPTVAEVSNDLTVSCVFTDAGVPVDLVVCLAAVQRAIDTAEAYDDLGQDPPQVDIGFLLCAMMVENPILANDIVAMIDESGNPLLALGCTNALPPTWTGPFPIISPA